MNHIKKRLEEEFKTLDHELKVTLPREILRAREYGDLRENAEYKAAKERQEIINARLAMLKRRVSDIDLVLDLVGGESSAPTIECLRDGGLYIAVPSASALDRLNELAADRVRVTGILVHPDRAGLEALAALTEAGQLKVAVEQTFPLEQAAQAHSWGETGRTQGKLVLTVD